jgi:hypothetical protein
MSKWMRRWLRINADIRLAQDTIIVPILYKTSYDVKIEREKKIFSVNRI